MRFNYRQLKEMKNIGTMDDLNDYGIDVGFYQTIKKVRYGKEIRTFIQFNHKNGTKTHQIGNNIKTQNMRNTLLKMVKDGIEFLVLHLHGRGQMDSHLLTIGVRAWLGIAPTSININVNVLYTIV